jgi:hypothetical protein
MSETGRKRGPMRSGEGPRNGSGQPAGPPGGEKMGGDKAGGVDQAFDLWLHRSLHQLYDRVATEPVPEELLRLIEEDRAKRGN